MERQYGAPFAVVMNVWLRRLLYLLLLVIWLLVMGFPVVAAMLATQGEIQIGERTERHVRLFLVQETDDGGLALEWTRPATTADACRQGKIVYFMWKGDGENASYCTCYDASGSVVSSEPSPC